METHSQYHARYYNEKIATCGRSTGYFLSYGQLVPFLPRCGWPKSNLVQRLLRVWALPGTDGYWRLGAPTSYSLGGDAAKLTTLHSYKWRAWKAHSLLYRI